MKTINKFLLVSALSSSLALVGCGGSDDKDSDSGSNTGGSNTGGTGNSQIKTVQATVDSTSARDLGIAAARGIKKAVFDSLNQGAIQLPTGVALGVDLSDYYASFCESGSISADVSQDGRSYTFTYNNCTYDGVTVNGTMTGTTSADFNTTTTTQTGFSYSYEGETYTIEDSTITCTGLQTGNYSCTSTAGWTIDGDSYELTSAVVNETNDGFEVTVTVADTEYGSIAVETTVAVSFDCPDETPGAGSAIFTGANNTSGQINFDSCTGFTVTVDGVANSYSWNDIEI